MTITFWSFFFDKKRRWGNIGIILVCLLFYTYIGIDIYNYEATMGGTIILLAVTSFVLIANFLREYYIWKKDNR